MFHWKSMTSIVLFTVLVVSVLSGVVIDPSTDPNNPSKPGGSSSGGTSSGPPQLISGDGGDQPSVTVPPINSSMNSGCTPQIDPNTGLPINADCVQTETNTVISADGGGINGTTDSSGNSTTAGSGVGVGDTGSSVAAPNCSGNPNLPGCVTGPAVVASGLTQGQIAGAAIGTILGVGALAAVVGGVVIAAKRKSAVPVGLTPRAHVTAAPERTVAAPRYQRNTDMYRYNAPSLEESREVTRRSRRRGIIEESSSQSLYRSPRGRASSTYSSSSAYFKGLEAGAAAATSVHLNNIERRTTIRSRSVDSIHEISKLESRLHQEREARIRAEFQSRFQQQKTKYLEQRERIKRSYTLDQSATHAAARDTVQVHHHVQHAGGVISAPQIIVVPGQQGRRGERGSSGSSGRDGEIRYLDHGYRGRGDSRTYLSGGFYDGKSRADTSRSRGVRSTIYDSPTTDSEEQAMKREAKTIYKSRMKDIRGIKQRRLARQKYSSTNHQILSHRQDREPLRKPIPENLPFRGSHLSYYLPQINHPPHPPPHPPHYYPPNQESSFIPKRKGLVILTRQHMESENGGANLRQRDDNGFQGEPRNGFQRQRHLSQDEQRHFSQDEQRSHQSDGSQRNRNDGSQHQQSDGSQRN